MPNQLTNHAKSEARPLRILYISPVGERGGAEAVLLDILKFHDRSRVNPMVCFLKAGPLADETRRLGVDTVVLATGRLRHLGNTWRAVRALRRLITRERVDLVFGNMAMGHIFGGLASLGTGARRVWFQHGIPSRLDLANWIAATVPVDQIYVNSKATAKTQARFPGGRRLRLVYYGLDCERFARARAAGASLPQSLGIPAGMLTVAMSARFQRWKGQHVFIRAAAQVCRQRDDVRFLLLGDTRFGIEPGYKEELVALVGELGLQEKVVFAGFRDDAAMIVGAADIMVHPAIAPEPFGLAVIEALLMGRPVVATRHGGPGEVLTDGETALLVAPGCVDELAAKILLLLDDPSLRRRLGTRGCEMASERFRASRMVEELEASFAEQCE